MSHKSGNDWQQLFAGGDAAVAGAGVALFAVRRGGEPWLLLPARGDLAAQALDLYPAQTPRARVMKRVLRLALRFGLKPGLEKVRLPATANDPLAKFISDTAGLGPGTLPPFALLAGNPQVPGRRFIFLLFGADGRPAAVVKAGMSEMARQLIAAEADFLQRAPANAPGLPRLRGTFQTEGTRAFALDFIAGAAPTLADATQLPKVLGAWLKPSQSVTLGELDAWKRLLATTSDSPLSEAVAKLAAVSVYPALTHGDLTPWNVKVSRGEWTVLDWERGELAGVPGWDWFHFVIQSALLVRREGAADLLARFEQLLSAAEFLSYAQRAGIGEHRHALALAYLANCLRVTRQTEGQEQLLELERVAAARWFPGQR